MQMRGIRGATTVTKNSKEDILTATKELLLEIIKANEIEISSIASIVFTVTKDLDAVFPAEAARQIGWSDVPLLCATEIPVKEGLKQCIRLLIHFNTDKKQSEINHIYLRDAVNLRR